MSSSTGLFEGKWQGKNFHICASHSDFSLPQDRIVAKYDDFSESEPNTDDDNFIASSESSDEASEMLGEIIQTFQRETWNDKLNKERYMEQQGKYQLAIHTPTNPGLHLSPEKRKRRNLRTAKFDKGLKESRGLACRDLEYGDTRDICYNGVTVKVFPGTRRTTRYPGSSCALDTCDQKFTRREEIIGALLPRGGSLRADDRGKRYWICYSHVTQDSDTDSE